MIFMPINILSHAYLSCIAYIIYEKIYIAIEKLYISL